MWREFRERWANTATEFSEEYTKLLGISVVLVPLSALLIWIESGTADPLRTPMSVVYVVTLWMVLFLPFVAAARHHWRQARAMDKVRARFAQGLEALYAGRDEEARRFLLSVQRWEKHWQYGNSWVYRTAYGAIVLALTGLAGLAHYLSYYSLFRSDIVSRPKVLTPIESIQYVIERPFLLGITLVIAGLWALSGLRELRHMREQAWRDYYGKRLAAALTAGKGVGAATPLEEIVGVSARELFGLDEYFTKAQLRRSWLRLARELHPDRWMHADEETRTAKEAALKRVNAARDQLERQAQEA